MKSALKLIVLSIAVFLLAAPVHGAPEGEKTFNSSGGFRMVGVTAKGPWIVEARAEGDTAGIWIADTLPGQPTRTLKTQWPTIGYSYYKLYPGEPRPFYFADGAPDTFYVHNSAGAEVKVAWTIEN